MKTKKLHNFLSFFLILSISFLFESCATIDSLLRRQNKIEISRKICAPGIITSYDLADYFISKNPDYNYDKIHELALYYVIEGMDENINYSVAFAQMCLETGYLHFGNLVTPEMNNFCGLGSTDADHPGESFPTKQLGVRAHIQHLQAYATKEDQKLNKELVDPRYNWVHKAKYAETIYDLSKNWATDPNYGEKIDSIITEIEKFVNSSM